MWKFICVLSSFLSKLISINLHDLYATWAALSSSTCLIPNKTSPQAVFEFFIYATENKKQQQQQELQQLQKVCVLLQIHLSNESSTYEYKTTYPIYINLQIRIFSA